MAPSIVALVMVYIAGIFSGSPIKTRVFGQKLTAVKTAVGIWSLARILRAIAGMWEE